MQYTNATTRHCYLLMPQNFHLFSEILYWMTSFFVWLSCYDLHINICVLQQCPIDRPLLFLPTLQILQNVDLWPHHSCVPCGSCSLPLHPQSWGLQQASSITGNFIQEASASHWRSAASAKQPLQEQEARAAAAAKTTYILLATRFLWRWFWRRILIGGPQWCWQQQSNWYPWPQSSKSEY